MLTLTKGFKKPEAGDKGIIFFPAMEDNIQQMNEHTHNGVDSQTIGPGALVSEIVVLVAANWVAQGGGTFRQLVTCPGSLTYDNTSKEYRLASDSSPFFPTVEKVSSNTFYIYVNDNTINVNVYFR